MFSYSLDDVCLADDVSDAHVIIVDGHSVHHMSQVLAGVGPPASTHCTSTTMTVSRQNSGGCEWHCCLTARPADKVKDAGGLVVGSM